MTLKVHILGHWRSLLSPAADYEGQFGKLENPKKGNDQVVGPCPPALPGPLTEELGSRVSRRALTHSLTHSPPEPGPTTQGNFKPGHDMTESSVTALICWVTCQCSFWLVAPWLQVGCTQTLLFCP